MSLHRHQRDSVQHGFTLVEMLLVMLVLSVLAGIALLGTMNFRGDASQACRRSNSRIAASVSTARSLNPSGSYTASGGTC